MSFILLTLADWAKDNNIILMVLPSSKYCNFQKFDLFSSEDFCNSYEEEFVLFSDSNLSKQAYQNIADNVYQKTVTKENLTLAFNKSGIYPLEETESSGADDS
jgi:thioredoxin-related protein